MQHKAACVETRLDKTEKMAATTLCFMVYYSRSRKIGSLDRLDPVARRLYRRLHGGHRGVVGPLIGALSLSRCSESRE